MSDLDEFLRDPEDFATNRALTIPGPGVAMHFKQKQFQHDNANVTGFQFAGAERVYWFDVGRVRGDRTLAEIQLQPQYEEGLEAAYWLRVDQPLPLGTAGGGLTPPLRSACRS